MDYLYFPGCTLYTKAKNLDRAAREAARVVGFELHELSNWTCCGAAFPLATDNIMALLPPSRILANAMKEGENLTTLCSVCFNVLRRTLHLLESDPEKREKIFDFIEMEYREGFHLVHYLEILRDEIGFENVKKKVERDLKGLRVAPFYGCMLLRPSEEMRFDDKENPSIFENLVESIGCKAVDFPYKIECCGSFQAVGAPEVATECGHAILSSALKNGAEAVTTTCPLCQFNLDTKQREMKEKYPDFPGLPVLYFSQLMGLSLGLPVETLDFGRNDVDPVPLLEGRGIL
ncbi:MAG: CoB--CoM heterodisulfide reductase iron-sulfur subunit B family protein [Deltaproteobacteria bacterium]|nr:CoB--CoM heterodisulfide reductase iron-sulfur subunit B family protein [Deltaproteobacteria bacterium]MBW2120502.1 CoB--CoM heterodisulfide reductase iron-sulfur subunit B family protein [Deltaproteobacteria bacterium]